jgi:hypothetical protein
MDSAAIYVSPSTARSLWQEYRIYNDRVEFDTHLGTVTVPLENIESVEVQESDVRGLLKGDLRLKNFRPAIKLDWANFVEHVVLDRKSGTCKRFLFTPTDPNEFKAVLDRLLQNTGA